MEKNTVNVVIVGAGLAGLSAAIEVSNNGASVKVLEMMSKVGGNSSKATSGINGVLTREQKNRNSKDTLDVFENDTVKGGYETNNKGLVKLLVSHSTDAITFLEQFNLDLKRLTQCGGHSHARTHRCDPALIRNNVGKEIIVQLQDYLKTRDEVAISLNAEVCQIERNNDQFIVTYVQSGIEETVQCEAVIVATGGYAANSNLIRKIFNKSFPTTNGPSATGSLMKLLEDSFDAEVANLGDVQLHPTGLVNPSKPAGRSVFLAPEALRAYGGILVNNKGLRFVNELSTRDVVMKGILDNCSTMEGSPFCVSNLLLTDFSLERFGSNYAKFYKSFGLLHEFENGPDFCRKEGIEEENLRRTLKDYNEAAIGKKKDKFGKTMFPSVVGFNKKIYRMHVTPAAHYCMGGIKITEKSEVVTKSGYVIKGLYAAGEVTTGVHGKNRLAGNSLLECVVFGRIAGENAAGCCTTLKT